MEVKSSEVCRHCSRLCFGSKYAIICPRNRKIIVLGKWCSERFINRVLNHELLHTVIGKLEGYSVSSKFDNLFDGGVPDVESLGVPNGKGKYRYKIRRYNH